MIEERDEADDFDSPFDFDDDAAFSEPADVRDPSPFGDAAQGDTAPDRPGMEDPDLSTPQAAPDAAPEDAASHPDAPSSPSPDDEWPTAMHNSFTGLDVLVTAGPTQEPIDPVRVVTNRSTGTMGYALARAAADRGASVTLVSGPTCLETPPGVHRVDVTTTKEMHAAVQQYADADLVLMAAAVADYTPARMAPSKIKKDDSDELVLRFRRTTDILKSLGEQKRPYQQLVGFALETNDGIANARRKLNEKNLDWIVLNNPLEEGAGFGTTTNRVTLLHRDGYKEELPILSKPEVANVLLDCVAAVRVGAGTSNGASS
jgi:phosphopantothenoylcysteine decarboxylase/phosphopantothenate--cysteine ligase